MFESQMNLADFSRRRYSLQAVAYVTSRGKKQTEDLGFSGCSETDSLDIISRLAKDYDSNELRGVKMTRLCASLIILIFVLFPVGSTATSSGAQAPRQDYLVYVVCESADKILIALSATSVALVEKRTTSPVRAFADLGSTLSDLTGFAVTSTAIVALARSQTALMFALPGFRPITFRLIPPSSQRCK